MTMKFNNLPAYPLLLHLIQNTLFRPSHPLRENRNFYVING